jgi:hypothetical protein
MKINIVFFFASLVVFQLIISLKDTVKIAPV